MDNISKVSTSKMESSAYVRPFRLNYTQDGKAKIWDLTFSHRSVYVIVFNTSKKQLVLVRQFRPAVYFAAVRSKMGLTGGDLNKELDTSQVPGSAGITLELCAGLIGKLQLLLLCACKDRIPILRLFFVFLPITILLPFFQHFFQSLANFTHFSNFTTFYHNFILYPILNFFKLEEFPISTIML
jgi:hypothetical protein